jgi:hypothetical protein
MNDEVIPPTPESPYDYWPIPKDEPTTYCEAPRHQMTRVTARWIESFKIPPMPEFPDGFVQSLRACDNCHEETLRNYLDEMLPPLTEEELEDLDDETKEVLLSGGYDMPDADAPVLPTEEGAGG